MCYSCKQQTQLTVAAVLSTVYAGLMVVVMVGIIQTFVTNNILDPSLFFIEVVAGLCNCSQAFLTGYLWNLTNRTEREVCLNTSNPCV